MADSMLQYHLRGAQDIARKLAKLKGPIRPWVKGFILRGRNTARKKSHPHPGDTEMLANAIGSRVSPGEMPESARIFTNLPEAVRIDQGRLPGGRRLSGFAVKEWAARHGIPKSQGWILAKQFQTRGTKGVHFMEQAAEHLVEILPEELAKATREIEGAFQRG